MLDNTQYQAGLIDTNNRFTSSSWNQWIAAKKAVAVPGSIEFVNYVNTHGGKVFFITDRAKSSQKDGTGNDLEVLTIDNLKSLGFEERLYNLVSDYLRRDNLQALPISQRALMTLVMRKLLASSTFAIAKTLTSLSKRLKAKLTQQEPTSRLSEELAEDYETTDETIDEWGEDEPEEVLSGVERRAIAKRCLEQVESEIRELDIFTKLAVSIEQNAKGEALLKVLEVAFKRTAEYGGARKALIFTESRRTQEYLLKLLSESAWGDGLLLFNGSNTDARFSTGEATPTKQIYRDWLNEYQGTDRVTGSKTAHTYRRGHPLAEMLVQRAQNRVLAPAEIQFDYGNYEGKITVLEPFGGVSGILSLSLFTIEALGQVEDYLVFAAVTEDGEELDPEIAKRLMSLPGKVINPSIELEDPRLETKTQSDVNLIQQRVAERNANFFEVEAKKLDGWADDLKVVLEREIKEMDRQIKEAKRAATAAVDLQSKLAGQKQVKALETQRNQQRRSLFDAQDEVDRQLDELIAQIESQLEQKSNLQCLFKIRWHLA